jgi:ABC-type Mn2+/Zn2+ transport system ATPase subunit
MGPNGSGKSTLSAVLVGNPAFEVTKGIKSPAWGRVQEKHFKSNNH